MIFDVEYQTLDLQKHVNLPLVAGGGDSVAGVVLLSFPQTGAGCRFKALISMFQQAGGQTQILLRTKHFKSVHLLIIELRYGGLSLTDFDETQTFFLDLKPATVALSFRMFRVSAVSCLNIHEPDA